MLVSHHKVSRSGRHLFLLTLPILQLAMNNVELSKLQRTSLGLLSKTFHHDALQDDCPLDHGCHGLAPIYDLETLSKLSTELQQQVLGFVDFQSLFTFVA
jgi:hypothetical protein